MANKTQKAFEQWLLPSAPTDLDKSALWTRNGEYDNANTRSLHHAFKAGIAHAHKELMSDAMVERVAMAIYTHPNLRSLSKYKGNYAAKAAIKAIIEEISDDK
ncbi:hypothetical protein [uncultured Paraglaciecola sp.]|uniref:hypothetical protein n=1 Tax=uncultured Paraglaciecola sp. TaxID=1765024 RepID=UPI002638CECC|nr:hypothetical protein [uncultured Paraglaciecola sp.]